MAILDDVKTALRISLSNEAFDGEVTDLIEAVTDDLVRVGVAVDVMAQPEGIIKRAIIAYCKGHFGYDNPEAERFLAAYDMMRQELSLSNGYKAVTFDAP